MENEQQSSIRYRNFAFLYRKMTEHRPKTFSNLNRPAVVKAASEKEWDLIIIGGGITGAGISLDAALRGLKVLLLEKSDFASGTSSKSTKLIHGGLRYLKQLELGLVRESGLERVVAHNNACHLVHPRNMLLPIVKQGSFSAFSAGIAIWVYDVLARVSGKQKRRKLSKEDTLKLEPLLNKNLLKSSVVYSEYRTDDARLTMELIKAARRNQAAAFNYMEVKDFNLVNGQIVGVNCQDILSDEPLSFRSKVVVNAAGPWVDILRKADNPDSQTNLVLSKGSHIVFNKSDLPINNSTYFDVFDGRMVFAIPRGKSVYVGTTDTIYTGNLDEVVCSADDAAYLLKAVKHMFDIPKLSTEDIQSSWAGLRPLVKQFGKGTKDISRKDEIFYSDTGLISIAGGKLTGFRKMAERVVDVVMERLELSKQTLTEEYTIHHNPYENYQQYQEELKQLQQKHPQADIAHLLSSYGKDAYIILQDASEKWGGDLIKSEVAYTIEHEAAALPIDFIERRTGWLYFDMTSVKKHLDRIIDCFATELGKDAAWVKEQKVYCLEVIRKHGLE